MNDDKTNILLINVHGGFPSSMTSKAFTQLSAFSELKQVSDLYSRAYPSNACASASLHDIIMDAPLGSMTDSVWNDWCHVRRPTRTLFHIFKQNGYKTALYGAFGLDKKLDPHVNMHTYPVELHRALSLHGIDQFQSQDAAFSCRFAYAEDKEIIQHYCDNMTTECSFTMLNLLGCKDIHKCNVLPVQESTVVVPTMNVSDLNHSTFSIEQQQEYFFHKDSRRVPESVISDNPRDEGSTASKIIALKRSTMMYDCLHGTCNNQLNEYSEAFVHELQRFAWECLVSLNAGLEKIISTLKEKKIYDKTRLYLFSDNPVSLFEHGVFNEAPWDACLRSFLLVHSPRQLSGKIVETPYSLAHISHKIMNDANLFADWHVNFKESHTLTIGICPSWLSHAYLTPRLNVFTFQTFYIRCLVNRYGRLYAIVIWFSLSDLLRASNVNVDSYDPEELSDLCKNTSDWYNPILIFDLGYFKQVQIYDLTTDVLELENLADNPEFLQTTIACSLKTEMNKSIEAHGYSKLKIIFPDRLLDFSPDDVTFNSVQLHDCARKRFKRQKSDATANKSTQTDYKSQHELLKTILSHDSHLLHMLQNFENLPLTIFQNVNHRVKNCPKPLLGIYTKESFRKIHRLNVELKNIANERVVIEMVNESVTIDSFKILSETKILDSPQVVVFNVDEVSNEKAVSNEKPTAFPMSHSIMASPALSAVSNDTDEHKKKKSRQDLVRGKTLKPVDYSKGFDSHMTSPRGKAKTIENGKSVRELHR